jgi:hypothetical protein
LDEFAIESYDLPPAEAAVPRYVVADAKTAYSKPVVRTISGNERNQCSVV